MYMYMYADTVNCVNLCKECIHSYTTNFKLSDVFRTFMYYYTVFLKKNTLLHGQNQSLSPSTYAVLGV